MLLRVLPYIAKEKSLALKGGTAINFFHRDMPRYSVDIDLTYLPVKPRVQSLSDIATVINRLGDLIRTAVPGSRVTLQQGGNNPVKLLVRTADAVVKVEPNTILRGSVFPPEMRTLCKSAIRIFEMSVRINTLSVPDLFGGKICAALDRQHPRDLFDVQYILRRKGITRKIKDAFLIYLISHSRPIVELLRPNLKDIRATYRNNFEGMTREETSLKKLLDTRDLLIDEINKALSGRDKEFLLSFKSGDPDWELLSIKNARKLPAVQWKLDNIRRMSRPKHQSARVELEKHLLSV